MGVLLYCRFCEYKVGGFAGCFWTNCVRKVKGSFGSDDGVEMGLGLRILEMIHMVAE